MQQAINLSRGKTFGEELHDTLVTLTLPPAVVTFRLKALRVLHLARVGPRYRADSEVK